MRTCERVWGVVCVGMCVWGGGGEGEGKQVGENSKREKSEKHAGQRNILRGCTKENSGWDNSTTLYQPVTSVSPSIQLYIAS